MADNSIKVTDFRHLREKAQKVLQNRGYTMKNGDSVDLEHLLHEYEIYQVELELQNEELRRASRELEEARNGYYELFEAVPVGILIVGDKGIIRQCNQAASRILSGSQIPMGGRLFSSLIHPEDMGSYFSYLNSLEEGASPSPRELRILRKDGTIVYVHFESSPVKDPDGKFMHWRLALVDITERKQYENAIKNAYEELETRVQERTAELEARSEQLSRLTRQLTLAEQRERKRLADLLHDDLQQLLSGAKLHLEMLGEKDDIKNIRAYRNAYDLLLNSIHTSRSLSSELSPTVLFQHGFVEALRWLARWMGQTHQIDIHIEIQNNLPAVQEDLRILLFQSVRELLFNVVKHAKTKVARVCIAPADDRLHITVTDQGVGFDPAGMERIAAEPKFGLFAIRERFESLGGSMDIKSAPGSGTEFTLVAPLHLPFENQKKEKGGPEVYPHPYTESSEPSLQSNGKIRVLLADDHSVMRNGLSSLLSGHPDIEVAGEAGDGQEAIHMARQIRPDVILMDINMPDMDGLEATRQIHREMPDIRILCLSMYDAADQAEALEKAGAENFLSKSSGASDLLAAIRGKQARP